MDLSTASTVFDLIWLTTGVVLAVLAVPCWFPDQLRGRPVKGSVRWARHRFTRKRALYVALASVAAFGTAATPLSYQVVIGLAVLIAYSFSEFA